MHLSNFISACILALLHISITSAAMGNGQDSISGNVHSHERAGSYILSSGLMLTGSLLNLGNLKYRVNGAIGGTTHTKADNFLEFVPVAELYAADALGAKHANPVQEQTKLLLATELVMEVMVQSIKRTTDIRRPDGTRFSFPSGHTAQAFAGATILYLECKDRDLLFACSGYAVATVTGVLRMTNNRHWISDVLASAGLGILVPRLVYACKPLRRWKPFHSKPDQVSLVPGINSTYAGFGLTARFSFN